MKVWYILILFGFAFVNLWAWIWFSSPTPHTTKTFTCTVIITDGAPGRLRPTTYEGVGYMTGDTLICKIK